MFDFANLLHPVLGFAFSSVLLPKFPATNKSNSSLVAHAVQQIIVGECSLQQGGWWDTPFGPIRFVPFFWPTPVVTSRPGGKKQSDMCHVLDVQSEYMFGMSQQ